MRVPLRTRTLALGIAATAAVAVAGLAGPAAATPPVGAVTPSPAPPPEAVLGQRVNAHDEGIGLKLPEGAVARDFTLTYAPGSSSGWHAHPGLVIATVVSGSVQRSVPCRAPETFSAGQAFVEVGPHLVQNPDASPAVLSITQLAPAGTSGAEFREDATAPVCKRHHHP